MLSVSEAAEILGVSGSRVRAMISSGQIKATKIGKSWALERSDVMNRLLNKPKSGRPKSCPGAECNVNQMQNGFQMKNVQRLYFECRKLFSGFPSVEMLEGAETPEEADFYVAVSDFFLQQEQRRLVKEGVF